MSDIDTHTPALKAEIAAFQPTLPVSKPHLTFASAWPAAREALMLLASFVPASIRMVISIVSMVGDTVAGSATVKPA